MAQVSGGKSIRRIQKLKRWTCEMRTWLTSSHRGEEHLLWRALTSASVGCYQNFSIVHDTSCESDREKAIRSRWASWLAFSWCVGKKGYTSHLNIYLVGAIVITIGARTHKHNGHVGKWNLQKWWLQTWLVTASTRTTCWSSSLTVAPWQVNSS